MSAMTEPKTKGEEAIGILLVDDESGSQPVDQHVTFQRDERVAEPFVRPGDQDQRPIAGTHGKLQ